MTSPIKNETPKTRSAAKAARKEALISQAARLFAEMGFSSVSLEEIGSAVGVSGPAIYRHFKSKQDLLAAVLLDASHSLKDGGNEIVAKAKDSETALKNLIAFHVDFSIHNAAVIRLQDSQIVHLIDADRALVRNLQREYISTWINVIEELPQKVPTRELRLRTQATFGLINSAYRAADQETRTSPMTAKVLATMAEAALLAGIAPQS